jgi:hypothetical protein
VATLKPSGTFEAFFAPSTTSVEAIAHKWRVAIALPGRFGLYYGNSIKSVHDPRFLASVMAKALC